MPTKISFKNDYSTGAHPRLLEALTRSNGTVQPGYGMDEYCREAEHILLEQLQLPQGSVHFVSGGTQANLLVLSSCLRPYEAVISAHIGHICTHEAGAIEATGHRILELPSVDGKILPEGIHELCKQHVDEHQVHPRMVYLSQSTELGTVYTYAELRALSTACKKNNLYLYADGARLGAAWVSPVADWTLPQFAALVDAFYIGGTKNGALCGEAVVLCNPALQDHVRWNMKQRGALLAKSRIFGMQFLELFRDGLYQELARHSQRAATQLVAGMRSLGVEFMVAPISNQIFPIFSPEVIKHLQERYDFYVWQELSPTRHVARLVTSWSTRDEEILHFLEDLQRVLREVS